MKCNLMRSVLIIVVTHRRGGGREKELGVLTFGEIYLTTTLA